MGHLVMAVVNGMGQAGVVNDRHTVGNKTCGNYDILHYEAEFFTVQLLIKIRKRFFSHIQKAIGTAACQPHAQGFQKGQPVSPGIKKHLIFLGQRIPYACPEVFPGGMEQHPGIDKCMERRPAPVPVGSIRMVRIINDRYRCHRGTVGGQGGERENGFIQFFCRILGCITGPASTYGKYHIRFPDLRDFHEFFCIFKSGIITIEETSCYGNLPLHCFSDQRLRRIPCLISADNDCCLSEFPAYRRDFIIGIRTYGIAW